MLLITYRPRVQQARDLTLPVHLNCFHFGNSCTRELSKQQYTLCS